MPVFEKYQVSRRQLIAWMLLVALVTTLAAHAAMPEQHETFQIVRIRGRRVHLRSGIPPQLNHQNVIRHLRKDGVLIADRIGYGIDYDGAQNGAWLHVIDTRDGECGWVNAHWVDTVVAERVEGTETAQATPGTTTTTTQQTAASTVSPALVVAQSQSHDIPPADLPPVEPPFIRRYGSILHFAAAGANVLTLLLSIWLTVHQPKLPFPPASQSVRFSAPVTSAGSARPRKPNFIYGVSGGTPFRVRR